MDYHDILKIAGALIALALYVPMTREVIRTGGAGQSFSTWLLWGALDVILAVSLYLQHGNYLLLVGLILGDAVLIALLLARGRGAWGRMDNVILALVLACLAGWWFWGNRMAAIASTLAISLAGIPGLVELWRNPQRKVGNIWGWYAVASGLTVLGGTSMTMAQRFPPAVFTLYSIVMFLAGRRAPRVPSGASSLDRPEMER